ASADSLHYSSVDLAVGLHPVPDEEVIAMYEGCHVPLENMSDFYGKSSHGHTMKQFMDIFSLPEMTLLSCVNDFFMKHNIDYEPVHLYKDVKEAIRDVHVKGIMYRAVEADIDKYICYGEQSQAVLNKLSEHGKKMFLITNSPLTLCKGMSYIVGKDWRDLFDVVIVQADKPSFFNDRRKYVCQCVALLWDRIHRLEKGQIYKQGNLYEFLRLTSWRGSKVLYFGDHIYSDLDLTLKHGWRTGAIIPELRKEIKIMNTEEYMHMMTWLQALTGLIEHMQVWKLCEISCHFSLLSKCNNTRNSIRLKFFLFRTYHNPTYFSRRLSQLPQQSFPRRTPLQQGVSLFGLRQSCFCNLFILPFLLSVASVRE
uniref:5'-nucleotidase domain containing 3 n=1 Tax=Sphaeramia orbicularis TaxID=375764 RepID=A0A673CG65_9TELE